MVRTLNQENQVLLTPAVFPILVFYLKADGSRILIDTGAPNPALLSNVLRQAGIGPREIDTVILTHLHFDHCANSELFPRARFFLQRREWDFAQHPDPSQRDIYLPELMAEVQQRDLLLVDGDLQLTDEFCPIKAVTVLRIIVISRVAPTPAIPDRAAEPATPSDKTVSMAWTLTVWFSAKLV